MPRIWNSGGLIFKRIKFIFSFIVNATLPLIQHCLIIETIIPLFQHSIIPIVSEAS